jgi:tripartite-type tricarboxylate transporter receptor subunit TctC
MKNRHRLALLGLPAFWAAAPSFAQAPWPTKPLRLIVPSQAGGILDGVHRAIASAVSPAIGQPIVADNKPGGGGVLGTSLVARAEPDGHTLAVIASGHAIHPSLMAKLPYDPMKDFAFVSQTVELTAVLVARPEFPADTVRELADLAKSKRMDITYGSAGNGQSNHLSGVLLGQRLGVELRHVPFQGNAPALTALLGGTISMMFLDALAAKPMLEAKKLKALGVTGKKRSAAFPDLPLVQDTVPGFDGSSWQGIVAPAGTPTQVVRRLSTEIAAAVHKPDMHNSYTAKGVNLVGSTPEQFTEHVAAEITRWRTVIAAAGLKPE